MCTRLPSMDTTVYTYHTIACRRIPTSMLQAMKSQGCRQLWRQPITSILVYMIVYTSGTRTLEMLPTLQPRILSAYPFRATCPKWTTTISSSASTNGRQRHLGGSFISGRSRRQAQLCEVLMLNSRASMCWMHLGRTLYSDALCTTA